jgi:hypothetical protein
MNRVLVSDLLGISEKSFYRWKEDRKIFKLLEKYFTDEDIKDFLENNKIEKLDLIKDTSINELKELINLKNNQSIVEEIEKKKQEIKDLENQLKMQ